MTDAKSSDQIVTEVKCHPVVSEEEHDVQDVSDRTSNCTVATDTWANVAWSWRWECSGAIVGIVCMGSILVILGKASNLALLDWKLPIQPNSLIAVFTTVGKTAMMVPLASCLSQLAWQHFSPGPRSLHHLQVFDDASRGPWGSFKLLFTIRRSAFLARACAVATLLALAIEPVTQQILEFPTRDKMLTREAGIKTEIGMATIYNSKSFRGNTFLTNDNDDDRAEKLARTLSLRNDIANAILGLKSDPYFYCAPTVHSCEYPSFTTLGVCSTFVNHTDTLKPRCETNGLNETICIYDWDNRNSSLRYNMMRDRQNGSAGRQHDAFLLQVEDASSADTSGLNMTAIRVGAGDILDGIAKESGPKVELLTLQWYWCSQTYTGTNATPAVLKPGRVKTEKLQSSGRSEDSQWYLFKSASESDRTEYRVYSDTEDTIWAYIGDVLKSHVLMNTNIQTDNFNNSIPWKELGTDQGACNSDFEIYLYTSDLTRVAGSFSDLVSNYIRSDSRLLGDNANATALDGVAWQNETYIGVRWEWFMIPLVEMLLVVVLLGLTIHGTKQSRLPLLGSSPLGLLFHGLDNRVPLQAGNGSMRKRMEDAARTIDVRFHSDTPDGSLRFTQISNGCENRGNV